MHRRPRVRASGGPRRTRREAAGAGPRGGADIETVATRRQASEQAVGSIDPTILAKRSIDEVQQLQEYWPYRTGTAELAGIWGPLRQAVRGLSPSVLATMPLQPMAGLTDRFRDEVATVDLTGPKQARLLQDVIPMDACGFLFEW